MIADDAGAGTVGLLPPIAGQHVDRRQVAALGNLEFFVSRQPAVVGRMDLGVAIDGALNRFREGHGRGLIETCCQKQPNPH
ncbi:hypothetical protein D3C81_1283540 [compost metagenome]